MIDRTEQLYNARVVSILGHIEAKMVRTTVCIPTYNQVRYVIGATQSARLQTEPVVVIVSNDASTDGTGDILEQLKAYENVTVVNHTKNLGIGAHVHWLLQQPETEYVVRLDSDDILDPHYVSTLTELLDRFPDAGYAHCAVNEINGVGEVVGLRSLIRSTTFQSSEESLIAMVKGYRVSANIVIFRRRALIDAAFGRAELNSAQDYDLCVRIANSGWGNVYCPQVLASYRVWSELGRHGISRKLHEVEGLRRIFAESLADAFKARSWDLSPLNRRRSELAGIHADALDDRTLTDADREELRSRLMQLAGLESPSLLLGKSRLSWLCRRVLIGSSKAKWSLAKYVKRVVTTVRARKTSSLSRPYSE